MNSEFFKIYGAKERQDGIVVLSSNKACIYVGFGKDSEDAESGYNWRKDYDHIPTIAEVKADIEALINAHTDATILTGFSWNGKPVYLSSENQFNFKAAYDLAFQTDGANLLRNSNSERMLRAILFITHSPRLRCLLIS